MSDFCTLSEREAVKRLDGFLPDRLFDAHVHLSDPAFSPGTEKLGIAEYRAGLLPEIEKRIVACNGIVAPNSDMADPKGKCRLASAETVKHLTDTGAVASGQLMAAPGDTAEELENLLISPNIRGFKCFHALAGFNPAVETPLSAYLTEPMMELAHRKKLVLTVHLMRESCLAHPDNQKTIRSMAKKYPDATLVLSHVARSFAAWTAMDGLEAIRELDNVWVDFSANCEALPVFHAIRTLGIDRCMWGSDYPASTFLGRAVSVGSSFAWIGEGDPSLNGVELWRVGTENLVAVMQACRLCSLSPREIEKLFFENAAGLFCR